MVLDPGPLRVRTGMPLLTACCRPTAGGKGEGRRPPWWLVTLSRHPSSLTRRPVEPGRCLTAGRRGPRTRWPCRWHRPVLRDGRAGLQARHHHCWDHVERPGTARMQATALADAGRKPALPASGKIAVRILAGDKTFFSIGRCSRWHIQGRGWSSARGNGLVGAPRMLAWNRLHSISSKSSSSLSSSSVIGEVRDGTPKPSRCEPRAENAEGQKRASVPSRAAAATKHSRRLLELL